jgi:protein-S-isoprenylcysteine O-methyltransferase Ste14
MAAGGRFSGLSRAATLLGGAVAYYALPIWGWGGFAPFFRHSALSALTIAYFAIAIAALFCGGNLSPGVREDRSNRWVLPAFLALGLAMGFIPAWDDRHHFLTFGGEALRWAGVALYALGAALRLWPVVALGDRFSGLVAIQRGHELLTSGPYAYIRHPSYLGLMISLVGWAFAFRSGSGLVIAALTLLPLLARIDAEERLLQSEFGVDYDAYRARTWRMIPGLW